MTRRPPRAQGGPPAPRASADDEPSPGADRPRRALVATGNGARTPDGGERRSTPKGRIEGIGDVGRHNGAGAQGRGAFSSRACATREGGKDAPTPAPPRAQGRQGGGKKPDNRRRR